MNFSWKKSKTQLSITLLYLRISPQSSWLVSVSWSGVSYGDTLIVSWSHWNSGDRHWTWLDMDTLGQTRGARKLLGCNIQKHIQINTTLLYYLSFNLRRVNLSHSILICILSWPSQGLLCTALYGVTGYSLHRSHGPMRGECWWQLANQRTEHTAWWGVTMGAVWPSGLRAEW